MVPAYGDAVKLAGKIADFISTGVRNADEIAILIKCTDEMAPAVIDALKQVDNYDAVLKNLPCKQAVGLFAGEPAIQKFLNIASDTADETADAVVSAFNKIDGEDTLNFFRRYVLNSDYSSVSDFTTNYSRLLDNVAGFEDELVTLLGKIDDVRAIKVLELSAEYGSDVLKAIDKCGAENIDNIVRFLSESDIAVDVAKKFLGLLSNHGDSLSIAVNECGVNNILLIVNCLSHTNFAGELGTQFLEAMTKYSDTMLEAIRVCGVDNFDTIADYTRIFDKFKDNAKEIVENCLVKEFVGLDEALASDAYVICLSTSRSGNKICSVAVNGVYKLNPTIFVPDALLDELNRIDAISAVTDIEKTAKGKEFTKFYNSLLTQDYINKYITDPKIRDEYQKLVDAVNTSRKNGEGKISVTNLSGIDDDFSFYNNRSVINCAEIWAAREMILRGYEFQDLLIPAKHLSDGSKYNPCKNCKATFSLILNK